MAEITPHDYQRDGLNQIYKGFKTKNRLLYQLSTGGGKTFVFSFLSKFWANKTRKKVLILCHRTELIEQTIASLNKIHVTCEAVTSKTKKLNHTSSCYVAMVETAHRRLLNDPYFFKDVDLVVADECHILIYDKVFKFFPNSKILGVTATPVVIKRIKFFKCKYCKSRYETETECCGTITDEWSRPFTLSEIYEDIIVGPKISKLIKMGTLVTDVPFIKKYIDTDSLKIDSDGEFTTESQDQQYNNDDAVFNVLKNYKELCEGKKTMIFNNSSKTNLSIYNKFKEAGYNVRMYDSVNKEQSGNRKELVKWFTNTPDAILCNVGVFTTGFDDKTVQSIILNLATQSLGLFIQICGRGARSTDQIYKDHFIVIDGGGNIDRHNEFSYDDRDWKEIFWKGIGKEKAKRENVIDVENCPDCGFMYPKSESQCPECGFSIPPKPKKEKELSEDVLTPIRAIPPPNGERIYQYTKLKEENINFAFKIMIGQIVDMFKYYRVTKHTYQVTLANGKLEKKVKQMVNKVYFVLLSKKDIQAENNRTISYLVNKVLTKLSDYYARG